MHQVAKVFTNGRSQAVRLPAAFRFTTQEVFVRRDPDSGDVILSSKPEDWEGFFALLPSAEVPSDFLDERERQQGGQERDPCDGWHE